MFHSDRGTQYTSADYAAATMSQYGIRPSVGRTGSCYDNAAAESFNATCKKEVVNRKIYPTRKHASRGCDILDRVAAAIRKDVTVTLGHKTPNHIHQEWTETQIPA